MLGISIHRIIFMLPLTLMVLFFLFTVRSSSSNRPLLSARCRCRSLLNCWCRSLRNCWCRRLLDCWRRSLLNCWFRSLLNCWFRIHLNCWRRSVLNCWFRSLLNCWFRSLLWLLVLESSWLLVLLSSWLLVPESSWLLVQESPQLRVQESSWLLVPVSSWLLMPVSSWLLVPESSWLLVQESPQLQVEQSPQPLLLKKNINCMSISYSPRWVSLFIITFIPIVLLVYYLVLFSIDNCYYTKINPYVLPLWPGSNRALKICFRSILVLVHYCELAISIIMRKVLGLIWWLNSYHLPTPV